MTPNCLKTKRSDPLCLNNKNPKPIHSGYLLKRGQLNRAWRKRWFVLLSNRKLLWYSKEEDTMSGSIKSAIKEVDLSTIQSVSQVPTEEEYQRIKKQRKEKDLQNDFDFFKINQKISLENPDNNSISSSLSSYSYSSSSSYSSSFLINQANSPVIFKAKKSSFSSRFFITTDSIK